MPAASVCDNDTIFHLRFINSTHPQPHHHPLEAQSELVLLLHSFVIQPLKFTQPSAKLTKISLRARRTVPSLSDMPAGRAGHVRPFKPPAFTGRRADFTSRAVWLFRSMGGSVDRGGSDATGIPSSVLYNTGWPDHILNFHMHLSYEIS